MGFEQHGGASGRFLLWSRKGFNHHPYILLEYIERNQIDANSAVKLVQTVTPEERETTTRPCVVKCRFAPPDISAASGGVPANRSTSNMKLHYDLTCQCQMNDTEAS